MSRLTRVIAPLLSKAGLDIRAVGGADGQVHELVVTNPRYPNRGRVVIDREGLMEWDYWGSLGDDHGAADIATVIITIMGTRPDDTAERYRQAAYLPTPEERDRPHP
jgi:hypothetical protein